MKSLPVQAAQIDKDRGPPWATVFGDRYHPPGDAFARAKRIYLQGNQLPSRWQARERFAILELGFGLACNFLSTVDTWQRDKQRCKTLHYVAIDKYPPSRDDLALALEPSLRGASSAVQATARALLAVWPVATGNVHVLEGLHPGLTLHLVFADVQSAIRELVGSFDAFYLDGFEPQANPAMWSNRVFQGVSRLAAPQATVATWCNSTVVHEALNTAGFDVRHAAPESKTQASLSALRIDKGRKPTIDGLARLGTHLTVKRAIVVGAGLAGAHVAQALARAGVECTVVDRQGSPAGEGSGGRAGIFHGTVHAGDGVHARLFRAAALRAAVWHEAAIKTGVEGAMSGLLRLTDTDAPALVKLQQSLGLPDAWAQALTAEAASKVLGIKTEHAAWLFAAGGWISPHALVQWLMQHPRISFTGSTSIQAIGHAEHSWQAFDIHNKVIAQGDVIVVANAHDAMRLCPQALWPLGQLRGQSSCLPAQTLGLQVPRMAMSGAGYVVPRHDGSVVVGASSHHDDPWPEARDSDTQDNLARLHRLTGSKVTLEQHKPLEEHVAWRTATADRLPIAGAVPRVGGRPTDNVRHVEREPGLYALTALGSRGLTLAPLMAEVVRACILREPLPLEASLLNAIDAARFKAKQARHQDVKEH